MPRNSDEEAREEFRSYVEDQMQRQVRRKDLLAKKIVPRSEMIDLSRVDLPLPGKQTPVQPYESFQDLGDFLYRIYCVPDLSFVDQAQAIYNWFEERGYRGPAS